MAVFNYQGKTINGKVVEGTVEAENESEARVKIRASRVIPLQVVSAANSSGESSSFGSFLKAKIKPKDLQVFTRQLSVLITAGVPIVPAMEALSRGATSPALKSSIEQITQDISAGKKMGEAFEAQGDTFDRFYVNMVIAGEEGGVLETVLSRLAIYIEKSVKLQSQIKGAMVYPIAVVVIASAVVAGLLIFVVPKFAELFVGNGMELPSITQNVLDMSQFLQEKWHIVLGVIIGAVVGYKQYAKTDSGRANIDALILKTPLFGDLAVKGGLAKFCRTLSTLMGAGVPIMNALEISRQVVGNHSMEVVVGRAKDAIAEGKSMAIPLAQEPLIPDLVVQMIAVGEQTGALDTMLGKVADFFEDEVEAIVASLTSLIEPILIVVLGGIIAFLVLAMYLPIFKMAGTQG